MQFVSLYDSPRVRPGKCAARNFLSAVIDWNITEFEAQVAAAMGPNQLLRAGSIEPSSRDHPSPNYIR
jgi:hypothetical protein